MKKRHIIIVLALAALPSLAFAQNKAIEELAGQYSDRDGFSTTVIKGEISTSLGESLQVQNLDISKIMNDISSIIIVKADNADKQFSDDVKSAVAAGNYSTVMSMSADGQTIKFLVAEIPEENKKQSPKSEFVIMILGKEDNMLVSIVGNYKVKQISKTDESKTK